MSADPQPRNERFLRWGRWVFGVIAGNIATWLLYCGALILLGIIPNQTIQQIVGLPSLFLVPFASGVFASWIWHPLKPKVGASIHGAFWLSFIAPLLAYVFLREGIICLIIVVPLLFAAQLTGVLFGRVWFKNNPRHLQLSILIFLPLIAVGELYVRDDQSGVVSDSLIINASPSQVWPELTAFPRIPSQPDYWLFQIGLPFPVATTSAGDFAGASRECIFSGNAVFKETVISIAPNKQLTFSIDEIPPDPELMGHLTPTKGQFVLTDNGDGTTTLAGHTWYTLHVRPLWYFDWWTHQIFRAVHLRVMNDIKSRAEAKS